MLINEYFLLSFLAFPFLSLFGVVAVTVDVDNVFDVAVVVVVMVDVDVFDIVVIIAACCNLCGLYAAEGISWC